METRSDLQTFPIRIEVEWPERFERVQLVLRVLVFFALATFFHAAGSWALVYLVLPLLAAVLIERHGAAGYLERAEPRALGVFEWLAGFCAYMLFVTDRLPLSGSERQLRLQVTVGGAPTVGSALSRLFTSLPHFILIALVAIISCVVALLAGTLILFSERCPVALRAFQQEIVAWLARLLVYHASLVESFPPVHLTRIDAQQPPPEPLSVSPV